VEPHASIVPELVAGLASAGCIVLVFRWARRRLIAFVSQELQQCFEDGIDAGCRLTQAYGDLCVRSCPFRNGLSGGRRLPPGSFVPLEEKPSH